MNEHTVTFNSGQSSVRVPTGTLVGESALLAGQNINQPCGAQGRCGRCAVRVTKGYLRSRSTLRLSPKLIADGYVLACQSMVEGDVSIFIPPQEEIERNLTTDRTVAPVEPPADYDPHFVQPIYRINLSLSPPNMDDQTDDWGRLVAALRQEIGTDNLSVSLPMLCKIGHILREADWQVSAVVEMEQDQDGKPMRVRLIDLSRIVESENEPLFGVAIDIGTTTVTLWLVDLLTGQVKAQVAEYNGQIARGEDIISRIIYASKNDAGRAEMQSLVLDTVNGLIMTACKRAQVDQGDIVKAVVSGNSTMVHLFLGISAESIRLSPFVTTVNNVPLYKASELGLNIHLEASVDCLPGVASYVGADITAGVLSSGLEDEPEISLFIDVGTNGEMVLGNRDWLVACACSAGPAFEGAGVEHGMRATRGAIEEVWINQKTYEPSYRVIGGVKPRGICGSGLISLLAELFMTSVIDKGGHINLDLPTDRVRNGPHGSEYVVVWADDTSTQSDIVITFVDIDNLLRAKAAIYAGFTVLGEKVGVPLEASEKVLIGGSFGKYINVEKAVEIGLLPDMPWENFHFLGNTSIKGAYLALLDRRKRDRVKEIASGMTYIELSADNSFYEAFTSALFLPHTDASLFPSVQVREIAER